MLQGTPRLFGLLSFISFALRLGEERTIQAAKITYSYIPFRIYVGLKYTPTFRDVPASKRVNIPPYIRVLRSSIVCHWLFKWAMCRLQLTQWYLGHSRRRIIVVSSTEFS